MEVEEELARRRRHRSVQWPLSGVEGERDEVASLREDIRTALRANAAIVNELIATKRELSRLRRYCALPSSFFSIFSFSSLSFARPESETDSCPMCHHPEPDLDCRPASVPPGRSVLSSPVLRPASAVAHPLPAKVSLLGCSCRHCFLLRRQGCPRRLLQLRIPS